MVEETGYDWAAWRCLSGLYGPVFRLQLAMTETLVIVSGRAAVLEFLGRRECDGRPDTVEVHLRNFGRQRGIVFNEGQEWIEQKRYVM
jgi:methyl farnesoate epoxidase/farnesoate epoxidase